MELFLHEIIILRNDSCMQRIHTNVRISESVKVYSIFIFFNIVVSFESLRLDGKIRN